MQLYGYIVWYRIVNYFAGFVNKGKMSFVSGAEDLFKLGKDFKKDLEEKQGDWKSKLSGAFSSEQIFFSLFVLGVFYAGYTSATVDGKYDVDTKNQGDIIESCYCRSSHSDFYRAWFGICCLIWLVLHCYTYTAVRFRSCENYLKFIEAICLRFPKGLLKCSKGLLKSCHNCCCKRKHSNNTTENSGPESQPDGSNLNPYIIDHYIKVLWFQYYKLYVIGYTKGKDEKIVLDQPIGKSDDKGKDTSDKDDKEKVTCLCWSAYIEKKVEDSDETQVDDCSCGCDKELNLFFNILKNLSHITLVSVKYLAQLLTMPLLFLQIFDTYALLCFSPRLLCSNASEYQLHLAQAAITLLFYCCLALSQLASTMLTWNPWPKKDDENTDINNQV